MVGWLATVCFLAAILPAQQPGKAPAPAVQGFAIGGIVVDSVTRQPIAGARVAIAPVVQRDAFTTVVTGEAGKFSFPGLAAGKYTLTAQRRGYNTQSFNQHGQFASSIAVGPGLEAGKLVFTMIVESSISGSVLDEAGEGIRDAQVLLFQSTTDDGIRRMIQRGLAMSDDEGHYHFSHLQVGTYYLAVVAKPWYAHAPQTRVKVTNPDGSVTYYSGVSQDVLDKLNNAVVEEDPPSALDVAYPVTFYGGATEASEATPIALGRGEKASADISLQPVPAVHWHLNVSTEQQQRSYVIVEQTIFDGTRIPIPNNTAGTRPGVLDITGLAPGRYVAVTRPFTDDSSEEHEFEVGEDGAEDKGAALVVSLSAALAFVPPATASGQIHLQLREKSTNQVFSEPIHGKGEIEFKPSIPRGTYEVSVFSTSDLFIQSVQATGARMTGRTLQVKGSAPVKLSVVLGQGRGEISGVALRDDKPVAGVMVVLVPADPENNRVLFRRDQSDSDGTFAIGFVAPGRYTVLAIENGWDLEWANPAVLAKFMAQGEPLTVEPKGKYSVKVRVQ